MDTRGLHSRTSFTNQGMQFWQSCTSIQLKFSGEGISLGLICHGGCQDTVIIYIPMMIGVSVMQRKTGEAVETAGQAGWSSISSRSGNVWIGSGTGRPIEGCFE
ncbi:hypothetical protein SAY86_031599 [Trapa natans]|uniref:Uncharacterized protein n=1 Tax=Trapa natans TaxID=22666 RepID=A0AAN7LRL5_TRANT|nr:hypothetical protein SAY86_031599 [Trapa natans]